MNMLNRINRTGWRYSFAILFNRIVPEWLFRCRRYAVYQLTTSPEVALRPDTPRNRKVDVSWCKEESEIQAVEALTYFNRSSSAGAASACQATIGGGLAGGFWCAQQQFDESELGVRYLLAPQQAWLFAALVSKQCRRQGVYNEVLHFMLNEMDAKGVNQPLVAVNPDNLGSDRIHQLFSCQSIGTVVAVRLFRVTVCLVFGEINRSRMISFNSKKNPIELSFPLAEEIGIGEPAIATA